jgi:hypothetical protein
MENRTPRLDALAGFQDQTAIESAAPGPRLDSQQTAPACLANDEQKSCHLQFDRSCHLAASPLWRRLQVNVERLGAARNLRSDFSALAHSAVASSLGCFAGA